MLMAALDGVKVVELCNMVAGPYCTKQLADFGAEVIKIENTEDGDQARRRGPYLNDDPDPEKSGLFLYLNTNKLGVTLNIETTKGKELFVELVKDVDILVEDNPPGVMDGLGLGYEVLKVLNPRLIMTSITAFGQHGPYKDFKSYPFNTFHSGAEGYVTPAGATDLDRPPLKVGHYIGEYEAGTHGALGTLIALYWQKASGKGQHIDISKQEALIHVNILDLVNYPVTGEVPSRTTLFRAEGGVASCADGYVHLSVQEEVHWMKMAEFMGNPDWTDSDIYRKRDLRRQHASEVREHLMDWAKDYTKNDIYHDGQKRGIPIAACLTPGEIVNSEQLKHREFFSEIEHSVVGKTTYPKAGYKLSKTSWEGRRAAPLLGEHNEAIYHQRLGYDKQELVRLKTWGVI